MGSFIYDQIENVIRSIQYDGGTDFGRINLPRETGFHFGLLFSDGLSTLGQLFCCFPHLFLGSEIPKTLEVPVYTFCEDRVANFTLLKLIARNSSGQFFNLSGAIDKNSILSSVGDSSFGFISVSFDPKISEV